jgi:hypothetical protein
VCACVGGGGGGEGGGEGGYIAVMYVCMYIYIYMSGQFYEHFDFYPNTRQPIPRKIFYREHIKNTFYTYIRQ